MQATTIETFVLGMVLEEAACQILERRKSKAVAGNLLNRLQCFGALQRDVSSAFVQISKLADLEADTYDKGFKTTYFARSGLVTVFTDSTERSPTFRLHPLDVVGQENPKCWIRVVTPAEDQAQAWNQFLGREFRGLSQEFYRKPFEDGIDDPFLRDSALKSLEKAGNDQKFLYDFSTASTPYHPGDLGIIVLLANESIRPEERNFLRALRNCGGRTAIIKLSVEPVVPVEESLDVFVNLVSHEFKDDAMKIRQNIALKMLLNAHSTAVMTKLGRVVGNTMTNVSPANLKLIGRATNLVRMHVNDKAKSSPISYSEANAVLFDVIDFAKDKSLPEVSLAIIRILEALKRRENVNWNEAVDILKDRGLEGYLNMY